MFLARVRIGGDVVVVARVAAGVLVRLDGLDVGGTGDPVGLLAAFGGVDGLAEAVGELERRDGESLFVAEDDVVFEAPVGGCAKLVCVALNYRLHAQEGEFEVPTEPIIFFKPSSSLVGHRRPVVRPLRSSRLDYEVELGVVIGKRVRDFGVGDDWRDVVAGYTVLNDVTARDLQLEAIEANVPWDRSKGFDTFAPLGPYLVTGDEVPNPHALGLELRVGDRVLQRSNTGEMVFSIPELLVDISAGMTLEPGDVIGTGTPDGIGPVEAGEVMEATIDKLGTLTSPVEVATQAVPA